jgi:Arc/MetJ-type ribon-helix-helix transcriptional regulator
VAEVTITLPEDLLRYANEQVVAHSFADLSELVTLLLREDRAALNRLRDAINEGERSGLSPFTPEQVIERARERYRSRAA